MTKTETKRLVAELRREAAVVTNVLTPTPQWILDQTGGRNMTPDEVQERIVDALNTIDGLSAMLREGWDN